MFHVVVTGLGIYIVGLQYTHKFIRHVIGQTRWKRKIMIVGRKRKRERGMSKPRIHGSYSMLRNDLFFGKSAF